MADVKWIKLSVSLPDNRQLKQIRHLPGGDTIALLWVYLLCLAGEINDAGMIYFTPEIPYTEEMLAAQFDMDVNTVRLGLETFSRFGMVEVVDNILCLPTWEKWQAADKLSEIREQTRLRVARHREKQKALLGQSTCQYCGEAATGYDHILAIARGGTDTEDNKVPCCIECNRMKNDKPLVDFLNANRERINDTLVAQSDKLKRYVTLCNVTGRYIVTQGNATEQEPEREPEGRKKNNIGDSGTPESPIPAPKPSKPVKHKHGEYKNVLLTDEELDKLKAEYPDWAERVEQLSSYVESTGKKYKSHYATIRNWARKDGVKHGANRVADSGADDSGRYGLTL